MKLKELIEQRYATKKFNNEKVPQDKVEQLIEMIRLAPSSFNIQPWVLKIITDDEQKKKLSPHCWNQPQITTCSHLIIFCVNKDVEQLVQDLDEVLDIPTEKKQMYLGMIRGFVEPLSDEQRKAWLSRQLYIALAHGMLASKELGFDSCPMEGFLPDKLKDELGLPKNLDPVVLMPIGYADDEAMPKVRFATSAIVQ